MSRGIARATHLPDPESHPLWPGIYQLLEPAAKRGECEVFEPGDYLWVAIKDGVIIGAATARGLDNGEAELMHVGGTRYREWAGLLESQICDWARDNGARRITAGGRRGWIPLVTKMGWRAVQQDGPLVWYEKAL